MILLLITLLITSLHQVTAIVVQSSHSIYQNLTDKPFTYNVSKNQMVTGIPVHNGKHEDKPWGFYEGSAAGVSCVGMSKGVSSKFGMEIDFSCGAKQASSFVSSFNNHVTEDRIFKFKCCSIQNAKVLSSRSTWELNEYDEEVDFHCGDSEVLTGLMSPYSFEKWDRVWRAKCAALVRDDDVVVLNNFGTSESLNDAWKKYAHK